MSTNIPEKEYRPATSTPTSGHSSENFGAEKINGDESLGQQPDLQIPESGSVGVEAKQRAGSNSPEFSSPVKTAELSGKPELNAVSQASENAKDDNSFPVLNNILGDPKKVTRSTLAELFKDGRADASVLNEAIYPAEGEQK